MADSKVTGLAEETTPVSTDLLYLVDDPGGTPISKKLTIANLIKGFPADTIDAITEIAAGLKSGADATLVTGTAGANGNLATWNADGDVVDGGAVPTAGAFSDAADPVVLNTTTKDVQIGAAQINTAKLSVDGDADQVQFAIQGHSTQTSNLIELENSAGTVVAAINNNGSFFIGGTDLALRRGAADTLRQIRSTNAQKLELYNTTDSDTSPVNYERGFMRWSGNELQIGSEKGGTGTNRRVAISSSNSVTVTGASAYLHLDATSNFALVNATTAVQFRIGGANKLSVQTSSVYPNAETITLGQTGLGWQNMFMNANLSTDTAPTDDTTTKKWSIQRLAADPTNAAFLKFSNSPGTPTNDFYLVLEEG